MATKILKVQLNLTCSYSTLTTMVPLFAMGLLFCNNLKSQCLFFGDWVDTQIFLAFSLNFFYREINRVLSKIEVSLFGNGVLTCTGTYLSLKESIKRCKKTGAFFSLSRLRRIFTNVSFVHNSYSSSLRLVFCEVFKWEIVVGSSWKYIEFRTCFTCFIV
jgi:hypothetical protein